MTNPYLGSIPGDSINIGASRAKETNISIKLTEDEISGKMEKCFDKPRLSIFRVMEQLFYCLIYFPLVQPLFFKQIHELRNVVKGQHC
jgi:hypothetical protein